MAVLSGIISSQNYPENYLMRRTVSHFIELAKLYNKKFITKNFYENNVDNQIIIVYKENENEAEKKLAVPRTTEGRILEFIKGWFEKADKEEKKKVTGKRYRDKLKRVSNLKAKKRGRKQ